MPPIFRKEYLCLYCEEKFKSGDWFGCAQNKFRRHQIEPKQYHSTHDNHVICCTKEATVVNPTTGESQKVPGFAAMFTNGHFTTSDPEIQEVLDRITAEGGLVTLDVYVESKLTQRQIVDRTKGQLVEQGELLKKTQEELARLKAQGGAKAEEAPEDVPAGVLPNSSGLPGQRRRA